MPSDRDQTTMPFPVGNGRIEIARDETGAVIGVAVTLLVLRNRINELPGMFAEQARAVIAENDPND